MNKQLESIDFKKLTAVLALLEGDEAMKFRAYLALGVDVYTLSKGAAEPRAASVAADFVRDLARRLEQHGVNFVGSDEAAIRQVLHQQPEQLTVGVRLNCRRLAQGVEGAPSSV